MKTKIKILTIFLLFFSILYSSTYANTVTKIIKTPYKIKVKIKNTACNKIDIIEKDIFDKTNPHCNYGCAREDDKMICMYDRDTKEFKKGYTSETEAQKAKEKKIFKFFLILDENQVEKTDENKVKNWLGKQFFDDKDFLSYNAKDQLKSELNSKRLVKRVARITREKFKDKDCGEEYKCYGNYGWINGDNGDYLRRGFVEPIGEESGTFTFKDFGSSFPILVKLTNSKEFSYEELEYNDEAACDNPTIIELTANLVHEEQIILSYTGSDDDGIRNLELFRDSKKIASLSSGNGKNVNNTYDDDNLTPGTTYKYIFKFEAKNKNTNTWKKVEKSITLTTKTYNFSWIKGPFSSCSVTCGGGIQTRNVYCERNDGVIVSDSNCSGTKPVTSQTCNTQKCSDTTPPKGSISYPTGWVKENQTIEITFSDPKTKDTEDVSGVKEIKLYKSTDNGNSWNLIKTLNPGEDGNTDFAPEDYAKPIKYKIIIEDNAGNKAKYIGGIIKYDYIEPNGEISYSGSYYDDLKKKNWIGNSIIININSLNDFSNEYNRGGVGVKNSKIYIYKNDKQEEIVTSSGYYTNYSYSYSIFNDGDIIQAALEVSDKLNNSTTPQKGTKFYVDKEKTVGTINYSTGYTNKSLVNINFTLEDKKSGIQGFDLVEYINGTENKIIPKYNITCSGNKFKASCVYKKSFKDEDNGKKFKYILKNIKDNVGNIGDKVEGGEIIFDNKPPKKDDLRVIGGNTFSATDSQEIQIKADSSGGSPITIIEGQFEKYDNPNSFGGTSYSTGDLDSNDASILSTIENISKVDNDKEPGNYRIYDYKIIKVCDEAGNCSNNLGNKKIYVYANKIDETKTQIDEDFTSGNIVANGEKHSFKIHLKDKYGNEISPVEKDGQTIRDINIDFKFYNNLHLNQYNDKNSAIFVKVNGVDKEIDLGDNIKYSWAGDLVFNSGGIYDFKFYSYGPTYKSGATDGRQYIDGNEKFIIKKIIGRIEDSIPTKITSTGEILTNSLEFQFNPIYKVSFSGGIKDNGLIEGVVQKTEINVEQHETISGNQGEIYFHFSSPIVGLLDKLNLYFEKGSGDWKEENKKEVARGSIDFNNSNSKLSLQLPKIDLLTLLLQKVGTTLSEEQETLFSLYVKYDLGSKNIIYSQEHIGDKKEQKTKQTGLQVEGYIANSINTIIDGTKGKELNTLGKLTKADFRQQIESNVYKLIKNIKQENGSYKIENLKDFNSISNSGKKLQDNSILYFNLKSGEAEVDFSSGGKTRLVTLGNGGDLEVKGKKTIVIIGADLYIKSNMYYSDKNKDILGIIVLKGEDGIGGDIYIDPEVTNIVGTYYMTKAIKSGKLDSGEIKEYTNINDLKELSNQLHIFGSIFSENTIGGARANPLKCPYYIKKTDCKQKEAQKYDLNFLRRYTLIELKGGLYLPINDGKVIGNGTCKLKDTDFDGAVDKVECGGDSKFVRYITDTKDKYAKQSTIIEYNSNFINNTPPMFR